MEREIKNWCAVGGIEAGSIWYVRGFSTNTLKAETDKMLEILKNGFSDQWPHGNNYVWRYMGLDKFLDFLVSGELHFQNLSLLTDKYEGGAQLPKPPKLGDLPGPIVPTLPLRIDWGEDPILDIRFRSFVNCWSIQRDESYALWKIYLDGAKPGVAITSTVAMLRKTILQSRETMGRIHLGEVNYFKPNPAEMYDDPKTIFMKMPYYEFEHEWRVAIVRTYSEPEQANIPKFLRLKINPADLIKHIYISPFMSRGLRDSLSHTVGKLAPNLRNKIMQSSIMDQ